jgi:hypothetical protein
MDPEEIKAKEKIEKAEAIQLMGANPPSKFE